MKMKMIRTVPVVLSQRVSRTKSHFVVVNGFLDLHWKLREMNLLKHLLINGIRLYLNSIAFQVICNL